MHEFSTTNILAAADWSFPVPIRYGVGRVRELSEYCKSQGITRPLLVTDRGSRDLSIITDVIELLAKANIEAQIFSEVEPNPTYDNILAGRAVYRAGNHDCIIAMGGGSGMDGGKAISLVANNHFDLWQFDYDYSEAPQVATDFPHLICIPTTAGTGAETDSTAMVTDTLQGIKRCVWHAKQKPKLVILDPELTLGLPANLTAWTGCDALVHAIEALSVPSWHPMCDGLALQAIRLIYRWLPVAVRDSSDLQARGAMLVGSCLAGIAFLKGLGLVHAMSHMVGAVYNTQHGLTNAILLPCVLAYNRDHLGEKTSMICQAMGLQHDDFEDIYQAVTELLEELHIPHDLAVLGVQESRLLEIADKAFHDVACGTNPRAATVADIHLLLEQALIQTR